MSLKQMIVWAAVVTVMISWLSASSIPGWLLAVLGLAVIPLGIRTSVKQKRAERDLVRTLWRSARRS